FFSGFLDNRTQLSFPARRSSDLPASPADSVGMIAGLAELKRQGFRVVSNKDTKPEGYFAGTPLDRMNGFLSGIQRRAGKIAFSLDRKSTRLNSSHVAISYAVFCL